MTGGSGDSGLTARRALLLFLLVLVLRVAIAAQFRGNYDTQSYLIVADATLRGQNVYAATDRYNYSPVWSFIVAGLWATARPNVGLFVLLTGLLQTLVDIAAAFLIGAIARRRLAFDEESARRAALLFFSNPLSVAVSSAHGQFDGISIFFLLAAIWFSTDPAARGSGPAAVASLSLSLLVKHITAFHPLLFWRGWRRPGLALGAVAVPYAVFALSFLPYRASFSKIGHNVLLYPTILLGSKGQEPGGLLSLLSFPIAAAAWFDGIALVAVGWVIWKTRGIELARASLVLFLALLTFLPSLAVQRFVWPVALGSLYVSPAFAIFSGAAALCHTSYGSYGLGLLWPVRIQILGVWMLGLFWLVSELASVTRERRGAMLST
jgi:hypothetical protein